MSFYGLVVVHFVCVCGPGVCVLGGEGEAVCGVVACSGGSAWVVCVAV